MGDADSRGAVGPTDEQDTIDGVEKDVSRPPPFVATRPPATEGPTLVTVEKSHYEFGDTIGEGGMGRVVKALDRRLGRRVAIKELLPKRRDAARRFEREARITARLQHPAIVHVYEAGMWPGGEPFYAMNHVTGQRLGEVIDDRPTLAERLGLVPNVIAVADALAYAHNENIIHRDLKPSNVMIGAFGETVVIDWGIAKDLGVAIDPQESLAMRRRANPDETNDGSIVGTPAYMPPEQARGESVDHRADVYSLGALLYHVLLGKPPFYKKSSEEVIALVKAGHRPPITALDAETPADLVAIVDKAMAGDPESRYPDAAGLAADLKAFQAGQLVAARNYTKRELVRRWLARYRVVVGIVTVALVVLAVIGGLSIRQIVHEKRQQEVRRIRLLEERGRSELLDSPGKATVYLAEAAKDGVRGGARGLLLADALRPFDAQLGPSFHSRGEPGTVVFSADGTRVITIDTAIHAWTDGVEQTFGSPVRPTQVLVSREGRVITVDGDHVIRVWSATGALEQKLVGHTGEILDAHLSADGRSLATGSTDGTARVWDLQAGGFVQARCGDSLPVYAVRIEPNGKNVLSVTDDNVLCYWDASSGGLRNLTRAHKGRVNTVRWSPDRRLVVTASDDGTVLLSDPFWGKPVIQPIVHDGRPIASAEFSSDGRSVLTAGADQLARLWAIPDELPEDDPSLEAKELRRFAGHSSALTAAVFDATDERIATASVDRKAKVWDVATGDQLAIFEHADVVTSVAFAPSGGQLLTASTDRTARLWNLAGGVARRPYAADSVVRAVAIGPDGSIAAGRTDSRISVWRPGSDKAEILRHHSASVLALGFSADGRWLVSGGEDTALVIDARTGEKLRELVGHDRPIRAVAFAPDGTVSTAGDEGIVRSWWPATGALVATLRHDQPLLQIAISSRGLIAAVDDQGRVVVWRAGVPQIHAALTNGRTRAIAFSDDGQLLVASGTDTKIYAVDRIGVTLERLTLYGPTGEVRSIAFNNDAACVITAGVDGLVQIWDADNGKQLTSRGTRAASIHALAMSRDRETLWVGGADELVRGWDIHTETRDVDALGAVMKRVPWRLDDEDVVRRRETGDD